MHSVETFNRSKVLGTEERSLPADTYNLMLLLFKHSEKPCLFVPVRSMQYQAVIDETEVVFVDAFRRTEIEFAWRQFNPQSRGCLTDPVPYHFVYYHKKALETMQRMQGEFIRFVRQLSERSQEHNVSFGKENIIPFDTDR